ncbi:uncharacterized protein AB675_2812 [Cyphellophora attinorum]|uniref:Uncharacterized protein n=1 Tax=Cyphellophora attinorum TaxID=1664694 RepID=A0A0N0NRG0_9EURO|nr:uncharacterized protein AB675_2812 [Phialophora attinorum]KPI44799.1 hypothetical protein AB675_2812 [Phialophora attinorum]
MSNNEDVNNGENSSAREETPTAIVNGVEGTNCIKQCGSCASFRTATPDSTLGCPLEQAPRPLTIDPALRYRNSQEDPFMVAMQEQRKYHQRFEEDFQRLIDSQESAKASQEMAATAESKPEHADDPNEMSWAPVLDKTQLQSLLEEPKDSRAVFLTKVKGMSVSEKSSGLIKDVLKGLAIGTVVVVIIMAVGYLTLAKNCQFRPGQNERAGDYLECEHGFAIERHLMVKFSSILGLTRSTDE